MTDIEQRAHDIAVAIAACSEQAMQNAILTANVQLDTKNYGVSIDVEKFVKAYKIAYEQTLTALKQ